MKFFALFRLLPILASALLSGCATHLPFSNTSGSTDSTTAEQAKFKQTATDPLCVVDYTNADKYPLLLDRIRADFQLQDEYNPRMDSYIRWYQRHPKHLERVLSRAERYLHHIVNEVEARQMPAELALLPIIESAFDPFAYSHGSASGIWQFISSTGKAYGLEQNWWYDGRRDIVASTDAALTYLQSLANRFDGDYLLALAAYNAGGGNVNRAIKRNKKKGRPTDFWSLKLPKETQAYIPQLLALSRIIATPEKYGLQLREIPNAPYFTEVEVGSQIDLAQAAELADIDIDELHRLNPGFNRWATAPDGPHRLLVPADSAEAFNAALSELPVDQRVRWQRYTIEKGDSLIAIASKHRIDVKLLKQVNNLHSNRIVAGKTLMIPTASKNGSFYRLSAEQRLRAQQNSNSGKRGNRKITYTVQSGDSFWKIAHHYGISSHSLAKWNNMAPRDTLRVGQKLVVWTDKPAARGDRSVMRKVNYRVRNGDSLARIAGKFNVSINQIKHWNPHNSGKYIHPGDRLTLFVDVTKIN